MNKSIFKVINVPVLDQEGFRNVLIELNESKSSDAYIKSNQKISFKKNGEKGYVTSRKIRMDEVESLMSSVLSGEDFHRIKNGTPVDFAHDITVKGTKGRKRLRFRIHAGSYNKNKDFSLSIRTFNSVPMDYSEVGLTEELVETHLSARKGLSLICGDTGSGKSTTQAALNVEVLKRTHCHLVTLEDPIEITYESVEGVKTDCTQYQVGYDYSSYADGARAFLRQNPDYIQIGEIRDEETMDASLTLAETGHSVSGTVHVPRGFLVFARVINMFRVERQRFIQTRLADMMNYIIFQHLTYGINGERIALREHLVIDNQIRMKLLSCDVKELSSVLFEGFKSKGKLIEVDASEKFKSGAISKETYDVLMRRFEGTKYEIGRAA